MAMPTTERGLLEPVEKPGTPVTFLLRIWRRGVHRLRERARSLGPTGRMRRILYVFDLAALPPAAAPASRVQFRELSPTEVRELSDRLGAGGRTLRDQLPEGAGCIVGLLNGAKVYHAWYVRGRGEEMRGVPAGWRPRGRVLFLHDGYTEPAFRGRGIHTAATYWLLDRERGSDVAHAVCVVHAENLVAARAVERVGFRPLARIE